MTLFNRHEKCFGLTLFRFGRRNVEVWLCPPNYEVKPHSHDNESIELMYICGKTTFYRCGEQLEPESFSPKWYHMFTRFTVKRGQVHWFTVSSWPLVFINFALFAEGHKPVSASEDFQLI